jgi:uncharacterized damage-inducible protein DinB
MKLVDSLRREFEGEMRTTRRHMERVPDAKWDWRPHAKSYTAGALASHLVDCAGWTSHIFTGDETDVDPATWEICRAGSTAELLEAFDAVVERCKGILAELKESDLERPWRLKVKGRQLFERPKGATFRDMTLNHLIHHRGQLTVYLRLLDVPVAGTYGPTADEPF